MAIECECVVWARTGDSIYGKAAPHSKLPVLSNTEIQSGECVITAISLPWFTYFTQTTQFDLLIQVYASLLLLYTNAPYLPAYTTPILTLIFTSILSIISHPYNYTLCCSCTLTTLLPTNITLPLFNNFNTLLSYLLSLSYCNILLVYIYLHCILFYLYVSNNLFIYILVTVILLFIYTL